MTDILTKYADLLVNYCVEISEGDRLYISTTTLAEPLVREVYRAALRAGAQQVEIDLAFREKERIFYQEANGKQLQQVPQLYQLAMQSFDAYLYIRAPFNLFDSSGIDGKKSKIHSTAKAPFSKAYFERTATRELRRNLCQYPTQAAAQNAQMSLEAYQEFVFTACHLCEDDPKAAWLNVRQQQQHIVDYLNNCTHIHYKGEGIDLQFSTKGRTWINSDGQTNMPSGEVYTSPVEDSVNGVIHYSLPAIYQGHEVEGITLWVKDGYIEKWDARRGKDFLDHIFTLKGTRRFGEAAIGTNYNINRLTKNILFDEKIGGTIHLAIGQSYLQCGGKNESSVHWDMISDMQQGGQIFADGTKIYEDGQFVI